MFKPFSVLINWEDIDFFLIMIYNIPMIKDKLNKNLTEGDFVIVTCKSYRNMVFARILKFSPKQVRVIYVNHCGRAEEYLTSEVVKIEASDVERINPVSKVALDNAYQQNLVKVA